MAHEPEIVKNLYLRGIFGGFCILLGVIFLKIHWDRHKDTIWGQLYRFGRELQPGNQMTHITDKIYLILGCLSVVWGLIVIFYGFRPYIVGK